MSIINNLFKKKVGSDLLKNKDFSASSESGGAIRESGRTMTEMLGTLAIIGVLSIGGIAGYNYAMDKYRANVTINDINLRAVDLITQAGREADLNLAEWGQTSTAGYTFNSFGKTDDGMIFLEISGIPKGVCNMVVDTLGEQFDMDINGQRIDVSDECGLSDNNVITVYFEGGGAGVTCTPACKEGQVCDGGICMDEDVPFVSGDIFCSEDTDCPECQTCSSGRCRSVANGTTCSVGTCQRGVCQGDLCSGNDACPSGLFCADSNNSCTSAHPTQCKKLEVVLKKITLSNGTSEAWYVSRRTISWWDAQSFCSRLGKTMVTVSDLVSGWNGSSEGTYMRTERAQKLYDAIGSEYVWTRNYNNDPSSCKTPHFVALYSGRVGNSSPGYDSPFALCRGSGYSPDDGWVTDEVTTGY